MRELIFFAIAFVGSLGFGLYRMRDRLGKFVSGFEDDTPTVDFYYDPSLRNYSYRTHGGTIVMVHDWRDMDGNAVTASTASRFE